MTTHPKGKAFHLRPLRHRKAPQNPLAMTYAAETSKASEERIRLNTPSFQEHETLIARLDKFLGLKVLPSQVNPVTATERTAAANRSSTPQRS